MKKYIPVSAPSLVGNERKYVLECIDSNWISSHGKYISQFEKAFSEFCGSKYAISCSNGTAALHIALLALGIGPGDEVLVPTLTYIATANAVKYCGAKPIFIDSEPETWNLDPALIEKRITKNTKAIIVVHIYGCPARMDEILSIANEYGIFVIEDAAEAHGARYKGIPVGTMGIISTFSFFGNKIITTGEGGMVVTNDAKIAAIAKQIKGQGMDLSRRYWFPMIGYNYRMTNIEAAIGLAQIEKIEWHMRRRLEIYRLYYDRLFQCKALQFRQEFEWADPVNWLTSIMLSDDAKITRDEFIDKLIEAGIETRPFFYPVHTMPFYVNENKGRQHPISCNISRRGINIPTFGDLSIEDIDYVCENIISCLS